MTAAPEMIPVPAAPANGASTPNTRQAERADQQFFGKYRGLVADNRDPLRLGRLKLKVPSVLGDHDECGTDWAWPCVPYGGFADQGAFFIPDIGAKVWVEFEEGNLDLPIWVGTFWSRPNDTTDIPAEAQAMEDDGNGPSPERRVLKTHVGHVLEFSDVAGQETVQVRHKDGAMIHLDEKGSALVVNKEGSLVYLNADGKELVIVDQHGNSMRMSDSGTTITNKDGSVVDLAGKAVQVIAKNVHIRSETVSLGEGATEPAILGKTFASLFDAHTHMTAWGPSGPPIPAPMPLSAPMNPAISKNVKVL